MIGLLTDWPSWSLTAGGVAAAIALLYLLRPRRRRIEVPFGGLWQKVLSRADARALGRNWRRLFSLLLMLTVAALLVGALGEPLLGLRGCSGPPPANPSHTLLLIDTSASMAAQDGRRLDADGGLGGAPFSRLDEARERVTQLVQAAKPGERFLLMSAAGRLRTRTGWTSDADVLRRAVGHLKAGQGGLDLQRAWAVARDAVAGRAQARIVLVSDGGPAMTASDSPAPAEVRTLLVGPSLDETETDGFDNLAIERVGIRPMPDDPSRGILSVRLRNDRAVDTQIRVTVSASAAGQGPSEFAAEGSQRAVRTESIGALATLWLHFDDVDLSEARFAVRVQPPEAANWRDLAAYDDWGYAVLAERRQLTVLWVGGGNAFLWAALEANPRLRRQRLSPQDYRPERWSAAQRSQHGVDMVILDQVSAAAPPGQPCLRFDPEPHPETLAGGRFVELPELTLPAMEHPLLRGLSLRDVNVDRARILQPPDGGEVIIGARRAGPVAVATSTGVRSIVVGFGLLDTDLGGRYALPIFMGNAIDWLAGEDEPLLAPLDVGRIWAIEVPATGHRWRHRRPDGRTSAARLAGDQLISGSEQHGIHQWTAGDGSVVARPTRLPPTERPGARQQLPNHWQSPPAAEQARNVPTPQPFWLGLLALAAIVLLIEWPLYLRRRTL